MRFDFMGRENIFILIVLIVYHGHW